MIPATARLVEAARVAGVQVVHCTVYQRPDLKATNTNARLFMGVRDLPVRFHPGSAAAKVIPEVGVEPDDLLLSRTHGLNPMAGADPHPLFRHPHVRTGIVGGVS